MTITNFRDLEVWQSGIRLVEEIYQLTAAFPNREIYGLASQLRRAAVSVPANVAEGHNRGYTQGFLRFLSIAQGSLAELETELEIVCVLNYVRRS